MFKLANKLILNRSLKLSQRLTSLKCNQSKLSRASLMFASRNVRNVHSLNRSLSNLLKSEDKNLKLILFDKRYSTQNQDQIKNSNRNEKTEQVLDTSANNLRQTNTNSNRRPRTTRNFLVIAGLFGVSCWLMREFYLSQIEKISPYVS